MQKIWKFNIVSIITCFLSTLSVFAFNYFIDSDANSHLSKNQHYQDTKTDFLCLLLSENSVIIRSYAGEKCTLRGFRDIMNITQQQAQQTR